MTPIKEGDRTSAVYGKQQVVEGKGGGGRGEGAHKGTVGWGCRYIRGGGKPFLYNHRRRRKMETVPMGPPLLGLDLQCRLSPSFTVNSENALRYHPPG